MRCFHGCVCSWYHLWHQVPPGGGWVLTSQRWVCLRGGYSPTPPDEYVQGVGTQPPGVGMSTESTHPPPGYMGYYGIWSTSGRYASYWMECFLVMTYSFHSIQMLVIKKIQSHSAQHIFTSVINRLFMYLCGTESWIHNWRPRYSLLTFTPLFRLQMMPSCNSFLNPGYLWLISSATVVGISVICLTSWSWRIFTRRTT